MQIFHFLESPHIDKEYSAVQLNNPHHMLIGFATLLLENEEHFIYGELFLCLYGFVYLG